MKLSISKLTMALLLVGAASTANANLIDNPDRLPQYVENGLTLINVDASAEQKDPLLTVTTITFPQNVSTVGQALNYVLLRTGYTLIAPSQLTASANRLMQLPLPLVQRSVSQVTVRNLIDTLIGDGFDYRVDPVMRTVKIICPADLVGIEPIHKEKPFKFLVGSNNR
ncbi:hypothetical protein GLP31_18375 [Photobacterium carnosum]|uniref:Pili assembly chaperone n=1 Tax=Photobacterium phosphoreum TaxID=659 RepID=A0A2T3JT87_PHOPO|nr:MULTISPECIES: hypothetical protein [Photobacterium]MCD9554436.1 hypothetical protein [Photobacterium carnosum]PSU22016.1 hypothetical protein CTM96_16855 [Photobacterium phosphoreum]PSU40472.1 hypothetical protein CTM97_15820 [Photobacterium phosphoreum]PSU52339.1 hypothetical protein C9J18_09350 [Photobacterium phosphoreum]